MRYIQKMAESKPSPKGRPKSPVQKFGGKGGRTDYSALADSKKIITPHGGKR